MYDTGAMNANQKRAVEWNDGPLLVLAGPGSGKTFVLTMRVARLIRENPDARFRVLGLTFTTKAADEMRSRLEMVLGDEKRRARLTTFHSFCAEVLRQHGSHLGLRPDFDILARDADRLRILDEAIHGNSSLDMPDVPADSVVRMIDHLFREGHDGNADTPLPFSGSPKRWMGAVYRTYLDALIRNNHLDYGALLVSCLRLFRERPRIARHYRIVYPYICVDEYQDTNKCQDRLLRFLCPRGDGNLFVVADDDQIIFQWNGASPARLDELRRDYGMQVIQLPDSYRCPPEVIELANRLIRFNLERSAIKEPLRSAVPAGRANSIRVRRFPDQLAEMAWIADDMRCRALRPTECVVLGRSAKLVESAAEALRHAHLVPYLIKRRQDFSSPPLRFVQAALRLAIAPQQSDQMRMMCKAFFDLTGVDVRVDDAEAEGEAYGGSLLRGFLEATEGVSAVMMESAPLREALHEKLVERLEYRGFVDAVFEWYHDRVRPNAASMEQRDLDDAEEEIGIWNELSRDVCRHVVAPTLSRFLQEMDLRPKVTPPGRDAIQCLTIHLAKGKEFEHVYLVGMAEDHLPSYHARRKGANSRAIEEERRECFVGITRAQTSLTLTYSASYFGWPKEPSRFLSEMGLVSMEAR